MHIMSKYNFDNIKEVGKNKDLCALIIGGSHNIFIDMIVADIKERPDVESSVTLPVGGSIALTDEFDTRDDESETLSLDEFLKVCNSVSPLGKWLCKVDYDFANKKDKERVKAYLKKPSVNAIMIVTVADYKANRELKSQRYLNESKVTHYIDIQYPRKRTLAEIVTQMFKERGYLVSEQCVDLFMLKMGIAYGEFKETIDTICERLKGSAKEQKVDLNGAIVNNPEHENSVENKVAEAAKYKIVDFKDFKEAMRGIDFFVLEDFMRELLIPIKSGKIRKQRKVYKILDTLLEEYSAEEICRRLKYRVEELLQYRSYINSGLIPVTVRYNAEQIKERLPENSKLRKATSMTFKRNAYIASLTSIEDWYFMYSILSRTGAWASEEQHKATLFTLMGRTAISNDRLMNAIRVKNTLDEGLYELNGIMYSPWWLNLPKHSESSEYSYESDDLEELNENFD